MGEPINTTDNLEDDSTCIIACFAITLGLLDEIKDEISNCEATWTCQERREVFGNLDPFRAITDAITLVELYRQFVWARNLPTNE